MDIPAIKELAEEDFLQLFAHLMDYAIRETYLLKDRALRKIHLSAIKQQNQLFVSCQFPTLATSEKKPRRILKPLKKKTILIFRLLKN